MKKRRQFEMAREIAGLRRLQVERARLETVRVVQLHERSRVREQSLCASVDAHVAQWRDALQARDGLSPEVASNWAGALASVRTAHLHAQRDTRDAASRVERERAVLARQEQQAEHARGVAARAGRQFERQREEQSASRIEDMYLSRETRP
ncbi:hypothetical protein EVC45_14815 [Paraburkholderia sp. UYCP14C]|uniref:hypothetical protein n=1 Tax=Paraburkholderia sp. UYCP14C TaxID=2511130 RepID=UPI00102055C1|nr:hypothetical protein [Paraburkholderia sp. UYCP14C]RZF29079.1 hypothetical protein EVC45_14815 [Paraburkholderia sp. UYCP14C]